MIFPGLTPEEIHTYLTLQGEATRSSRFYLYRKIGLPHFSRVLEIGSGTGAILKEIRGRVPSAVGIELDLDSLMGHPSSSSIGGRAEALPFADSAFEVIFTHFTLAWIVNLSETTGEIHRILGPGGRFLFVEPLYRPDGDHRAPDGIRMNLPERLTGYLAAHHFTITFLEETVGMETPDSRLLELEKKMGGGAEERPLPLLLGVAERD